MIVAAEHACRASGKTLGGIDIALHFDERDRALGEPSVRMKDCILRVLPALVDKALLGRALILDKAVAILIGRSVDPGERRLDMRPEGAQRFFIARTLGVKAGQHDEQRGRIDATVIEAERHFVERGHLSTAHLVQNFPGSASDSASCRVA